MLSALSIAIPFAFRGTLLQIYIPAFQYSGTAASHVPSMLAIAVGLIAAVIVGLASTLGFAAKSSAHEAQARVLEKLVRLSYQYWPFPFMIWEIDIICTTSNDDLVNRGKKRSCDRPLICEDCKGYRLYNMCDDAE